MKRLKRLLSTAIMAVIRFVGGGAFLYFGGVFEGDCALFALRGGGCVGPLALVPRPLQVLGLALLALWCVYVGWHVSGDDYEKEQAQLRRQNPFSRR